MKLIFGAVMLWSTCTILSGFVSSFTQLMILRVGLALGEASLFPTVHSLLPDLSTGRSRTLAATIFSASPPVGSAQSFVAGGSLVELSLTNLGEGATRIWW